jgi:hypothetical protein
METPKTSTIVRALKSGEYDGTMLMMAWCRLRQQEERIADLLGACKQVVGDMDLPDHEYSSLENAAILLCEEAIAKEKGCDA